MYVNALGIALHPVVLSSLSPTGCNVMKLSVDDVLSIRKHYQAGMKQVWLAMKYGVSQQQISRVLKGDRWLTRIQRANDKRTHKMILDAIAARDITDVQPKG